MKKFEEELFSEVPCKFELSTEGEYKQSILVKHFGDWISPEDHQAEIYQRKQQYEEHQEIYSKTAKKLNEAELEISKLKSQLEKQQPEIPEVPECVAEWIEILKTKGLKPLKNPETYGETGFTEEKLQNIVFWISEHQEDYMRAWLDGYTVAKEKRFYLKNKLTGQRLIRLLEENGGGFLECVTSTDKERMQFTQSEIDSMATDSYEQIEVAE